MDSKKEEDIFNISREVVYGNVEDSDILSLTKNKKRLYKLRKYKSELVDAIDGTNPNWEKYLKDFHLLLEVAESDFLDCNQSVKEVDLTENGLGQLFVWTAVIDVCVGK